MNNINLNLASGFGTTLLACAAVAVALTWLPGVVYCALLVVVKRCFVGRFEPGENQDRTRGSRFRFWLWSRMVGSPFYLGTLMPFSFTYCAKQSKIKWWVDPSSSYKM